MRLLALDEREEPFTLYRLNPGDQAGHIGLLRGVTGFALAASQPSLLWLMPQAGFLKAVTTYPQLQLDLASSSLEEIYGVAISTQSPHQTSRIELKDWASSQLNDLEDDNRVLIVPPGEHQFDSKWGPWLVSSSNIAGSKPGEELLGPLKVTVQGKIPARLLAKSSATPPMEVPPVMVVTPETGELAPLQMEAELVEPNWEESSSAIVAVEKQQEALEDWYGRLGNDGSFPHLEGKGPIDAPLSVLRMLARYFDLPFRKDVLERILQDQLERSAAQDDSSGIGLLQLAAVADLIGLRASQLKINDKQVPRLQLPAIAWVQTDQLLFGRQI